MGTTLMTAEAYRDGILEAITAERRRRKEEQLASIAAKIESFYKLESKNLQENYNLESIEQGTLTKGIKIRLEHPLEEDVKNELIKAGWLITDEGESEYAGHKIRDYLLRVPKVITSK